MAGPLAKLWNRDWAVGIGGRMFLAFGTTSALVLAAAIVGWLGFAKVAQKQQSVVHEALPAMIAAQTLAKVNAQIVTAAPALTSATGNQERQTAYDEISSQTGALNTLLTRIGQFDFDSERISDLKRTVDSIASNLAKQNELVARRLRSTRRLEETTAESLQAAAELSDISRSLVANSAATTTAVISSLYDLVEAPDQTESLLEAFDRLVEVDVDSMERMIQLQLGSAVLGGYINQLNSESDPPSVGFLEHEYRNTLTILARRIEDINDPGRQRQAKTLMRRLTAFGAAAGPEGIFDLRRNILEIGLELERLNERNRALGAALNTIVSDLVVDATEAIDRATEEAETAVTQGRTAFLSITIFSLVIAALILWLYVQRSVVRRLALLDGTMRALAGGDYSAEIKATGNDELTKMTETVRVFRDNAIEKTQLEQERERVASELRSYQRDLEKLVTDRTTQLEEANVRLAEEAGRHRAARNAAEQASQAKTAFLATMSHEIRTPMSGILGTLRLLKGDALSEQQRQYVDLVSSAGEALLVLLNDILDYSKIETGQPELEYSDFDLRVLIGEMEALMRPAAQEHNIHLSTNIAVDVPTALSGAPGRLRQILFNLIGNAVKFTPRGQIQVRVQCAETNPDQGLRLRFEVTDTGIGIAAEYRDKVFEAFTQVDSSLSRSYEGAGLGLAICKRLTTAMGGDIGIGPTPTGGTLVWCELPFMAATLPQQSAAANTLAASSTTTDPLAVLLVEDNEINQLVVTAYLESQSHTVTLARNGAEAVDRCRRNRFDAVLMDISMPGTDGLEATRQIREIPDPEKSSIPIIAMSAHVFQEEVEQYLAAGMDGFLGKPINPERLSSVLFEVVQKHIDTVSLPSPAADGKAPLVDPDVLAQDLEALGKRTVVDLVTTFLASTRRTLDSLLRAMDRGDLKQMGADAHSLKGAAASVGLVEMHEHLHTLESAARRGQGDEASRLAAGLETLHQASCHALESALNHLIANTHETV